MELYIEYLNDFSQGEFDNAFNMMDEARKKAVLRMKFENDRRRSVLGESLARKGISKLCDIKEREILFDRTESGKPFVTNARAFFSVSHSKEMVVCAVDDQEIGVDAEFIRDIDLSITRIACTEKDKEFIFSSDDKNEQINRFFTVWTAKEAYFKFIGTGIIGLKTIDYEEIKPFCRHFREGDYMIAVYSKEKL